MKSLTNLLGIYLKELVRFFQKKKDAVEVNSIASCAHFRGLLKYPMNPKNIEYFNLLAFACNKALA